MAKNNQYKDDNPTQYQEAQQFEATQVELQEQEQDVSLAEQPSSTDTPVIIKIGEKVDVQKTANKFDIFWLKVWAAICSFVQSVAIGINKGIKFVFKKEAPLKYVKAVIAIILIIIAIAIVSAPFNITVNEVQTLEIYPNGLTVVQKQVAVNTTTNAPIYKYGYANSKGKIKIDCIYDNAMSFKYNVAWVNIKELNADGDTVNYWMLINTRGKQVGELKIFQNGNVVPVSTFGDKYKLAAVNLSGTYGFVNTSGKIVIDCNYDEVGNFDYKLARVRRGSETYFINNKGKKISQTYYVARDFKEGIAAVGINNLWGFIDESGNLIGEVEYDNVSDFKQGYALVKRGATYGIIDQKGNKVVNTGVFTDLELVDFFEMPE
ncbi:MAG: WG repeat-containing protein [Christensenellales bacterium]